MATTRRAIGIVRVSKTAGREGESFASPQEQADRIAAACKRDGIALLETFEELDISGGRSLDKRPGLLRAVQEIEAGRADVVAAAYFDRLFRSLTTQAEVIKRVEAAGGQVLAVDVGQVTDASAGQWLTGTMHGMIAEYYRRSMKERSGEALKRAVARGVPPWDHITPGYARGQDGRFEVNPDVAPFIEPAFEIRAGGGTIQQAHEFLHGHGVEISYQATRILLRSRVVLGEINFGRPKSEGGMGELKNLEAHPPIVDRELWERVQRMRVPRGRRPKSEQLLARLGILRCGNCGRPLSAGFQQHTRRGVTRRYPEYRCGGGSATYGVNGCPRRVAISAHVADRAVVDKVRDALANWEGWASAEKNVRDAEEAAEETQAALDAAASSMAEAGLMTEPAFVKRLTELRQARDDASEQLRQISGPTRTRVNVTDGRRDWDQLTTAEQRELIRALVWGAVVLPSSGEAHHAFGEVAASMVPPVSGRVHVVLHDSLVELME